ncbi:hypothetical protein [Staphylococcus lutrae]|uniref:Uncharacterized protein n=1 Tax=Staphylococcus lutrae TaxID=155085 RepID=A0AAC9RNU3_9STAP|nr:hypothetical protein [Staphylococcus lutrae]ARJ51008.1 hypothetical protein B5P37_06580 [Staphylococcus lutrae]PNZ37146.1 hypothetical protein CD134_07000 [Staphylococcus lutrae]
MTPKVKARIYLILIIISTIFVLSCVLFNIRPILIATVTFIAIMVFLIVYFVVPTKQARR